MDRKRKSRAVGVRMREDALERVEIAAAVEGQSRSRFVAEAAEERARRRLEELREQRGGEGDGGE